jgi:hypothetical protein
MTAWLHPFVQNPDYLDQARPDYMVIENVYRSPHPLVRVIRARVTEMKATDAAPEVGAFSRRGSRWICSYLQHRGPDERRVAASAVGSPSTGAGFENMRQIGLGWSRESKSGHEIQR